MILIQFLPPIYIQYKSQVHQWQSKLWRLAKRVRLPPRWTFAQLTPLFVLFLAAVEFVRRLRTFQLFSLCFMR